ncbi:hypothetical protein Gasu2_34160 [Galdieria sulphuraria]|nr:hypothetical protein Gasu2_34160 [Galdieria sulphuraria]
MRSFPAVVQLAVDDPHAAVSLKTMSFIPSAKADFALSDEQGRLVFFSGRPCRQNLQALEEVLGPCSFFFTSYFGDLVYHHLDKGRIVRLSQGPLFVMTNPCFGLIQSNLPLPVLSQLGQIIPKHEYIRRLLKLSGSSIDPIRLSSNTEFIPHYYAVLKNDRYIFFFLNSIETKEKR